jgi:DNA-binding MarR family transcriptional regulator
VTTKAKTGLDGVALDAWRGYLLSHAAITRELDAALLAEHGLTARDYEVLLFLAQEEGRRLAMSELAERTMLTRSGITRLVDGLSKSGLVERVSCPEDLRVSYCQLTDEGFARLRAAGPTHIESVHTAFLQNFSEEEVEVLAKLLARLPGAGADGSACSVE